MNDLNKKLFIIKEVFQSDWNTLRKIVDLLNKDEAFVIDFKDQREKFKQEFYPLNKEKFKDIHIWSTYEKCIWNKFFLNDKILYGDLSIYDGNNFSGKLVSLRFSVTVKLPMNFIDYLKDSIEYTFEDYMENQYIEHLQKVKEAWINKKSKELLKE